MKISDFAILAGAVMISVLPGWNYQNDILWQKMQISSNLNDVMDEAVRDALEKSFIDTDVEGRPIIDRYGITDILADEVAFVYYGNTHDAAVNRVKAMLRACFLIEKDVMHVYEFGEYVTDISLDTESGSFDTAAIAAMESVTGTKLMLPYNDGEDYMQKIGEYSYTAIVVRDGKYTAFSSAGIKNVIS